MFHGEDWSGGKGPETTTKTPATVFGYMPGKEQADQPPLCGDSFANRHRRGSIPRKLTQNAHSSILLISIQLDPVSNVELAVCTIQEVL